VAIGPDATDCPSTGCIFCYSRNPNHSVQKVVGWSLVGFLAIFPTAFVKVKRSGPQPG
jgi:hypothetical protein